jgi:hypothetical protein
MLINITKQNEAMISLKKIKFQWYSIKLISS